MPALPSRHEEGQQVEPIVLESGILAMGIAKPRKAEARKRLLALLGDREVPLRARGFAAVALGMVGPVRADIREALLLAAACSRGYRDPEDSKALEREIRMLESAGRPAEAVASTTAASTTWAYSYVVLHRSNVRIDALYNLFPMSARAVAE